ncbi:helix-turn-helix transcriptional regulator [Streptomyces sp. NPDC059785]|uniref:helix-turn-helix domain-containing protein n=1 Tax=unclassified Streptomyces TaxID=2593676 RepID=UPI00365ED328
MPPRPPASARRLRLAAELRKMRERAGMTATEAARTLGIGQGQLSNIESARFGVGPDRLRAMTRMYDCADQAFIEELVRMATEKTTGWWETYREFLPASLLHVAELEHHSTAVRTVYSSYMPGLLQTSDHAREIFRHAIPALTPAEAEHRLSFRLSRKQVLHETHPVNYRTVIHEAALRMNVGGRTVARAQLQHLLDMSEREHITVRVLPFDVGAFPGAGQSINYLHGPVPQLDTAQLDQFHAPVQLDAEALLDKYRLLLDTVEGIALAPEKSRALINTITREL